MRGYVQHYRPNNLGWFDHLRRYTEKELTDRYTRGECWHFARALRRLFGWQLVVVSFNEHLLGPECMHAMAQRPDGCLVDFEGPHRVADLVDRRGEGLFFHGVRPDHYGKLVRGCCRYSEQFARQYILRNHTLYHGRSIEE